MKMNLNKEWFEKRIDHHAQMEVGAGNPCPDGISPNDRTAEDTMPSTEDFSETLAFGTLIEFLRRDRQLTIEHLASEARVELSELVSIEFDPKYVPSPRCVFQLASFFELPQRSLLKLSNVTTVHSDKLRDAAVRFAANASNISQLSREERVALADFVAFLSNQDSD